MVRFGLQRWASGRLDSEKKGPEFRETAYKQVVADHLAQLEDWAKLDPAITTKIRRSMYKHVLRLGGIEHKQDKPVGLSDTAKQKALQDLASWVGDDSD
ncbi:hypothetical protein BC835DRAFT_1370275 [Cytidiella melzeri]|nr:hypothetical protein BC835DRAFT_1370275 [Cytidiella melzeri]